jgi:hypothetical protein
MTYELKIIEKAGYLHGIVTGRNSREAVSGYLKQGLEICVARNCTHALIEAHLEGPRLALWDIFEIATQHSRQDIGHFDSIAYVDPRAPGELLTFVQNVTCNRGLPLRVFTTVEAAEQWLLARLAESSTTSCAVE